DALSASEKVKRIEANPPVEQRGDIIVIGKIDDPELRKNVSISYEITVPADSKLRTQSGSGDIDVAGVNGTLRASTGSGNVNAKQIGNEVRVNTGSGDVRLDAVKGRVYATAGSGNVQAYAVSGGFYGQTGSGDITFEQNTSGDVTVKTGSGNIRAKYVKGGLDAHTGSGDIEVDGEAKGDWNVSAGSGNISLRLPQNSAFTVDARSSSGQVSVNHPVTIQGTVKRNRLQGKVGAGGVLLSLESGSGNIRID
ncbi:MAG TPA: DUF4097 family beta strand repeat-containing protein, partial [Terriglobales bacterium]|nr:DUF4097 family beta strand repeat-containing protein [Terriglobales bacterium]